jgi:hypothetical protein
MSTSDLILLSISINYNDDSRIVSRKTSQHSNLIHYRIYNRYNLLKYPHAATLIELDNASTGPSLLIGMYTALTQPLTTTWNSTHE